MGRIGPGQRETPFYDVSLDNEIKMKEIRKLSFERAHQGASP
jgi:hypothetical protein